MKWMKRLTVTQSRRIAPAVVNTQWVVRLSRARPMRARMMSALSENMVCYSLVMDVERGRRSTSAIGTSSVSMGWMEKRMSMMAIVVRGWFMMLIL